MAGRPSPIRRPIGGTNPDGTRRTVADGIVELLAAGNYFEVACEAHDITRETGSAWLRTATRVGADLAARHRTRTSLTAHEQACLGFSDAVRRANAEWEAKSNVLLEQIAQGGIEVKTITRKVDAQGHVLETRTTVETTLPDAHVLMNRLAQRFPERYRKRLEVTGAEGGPLLGDVEARLGRLAALLEGQDPDAEP